MFMVSGAIAREAAASTDAQTTAAAPSDRTARTAGKDRLMRPP